MVKRFYRTFALAVAGMLCLLNTASAQTGTVTTGMEKNILAHPVAVKPEQMPGKQAMTKNKASLKKKGTRGSGTKGRRQNSDFFVLSRLILGDAIISNNSAEIGANAFDLTLLDRILGAKGMEWSKGLIFVAYDDGHAEALSNGKTIPRKIAPQFLYAGKSYSFFGDFSSPALQDPRVLMVDNLPASDEIIGFESDNIFGTYSGSKGLQHTKSESIGRGSSTPFAYRYKMDTMLLNAGVSWINDIVDSNGISKTFKEAGFESASNKVSGLNLNLGASYRTFSLTGGYIHALDSLAPAQLSTNGNETRPSAWNSEFAYSTELLRRETVLAIGYQKSLESLKLLYLPEQRYITKASMVVLEGTTLSLEYYMDRDNSQKDGGIDAESYGVTTRVGFEF